MSPLRDASAEEAHAQENVSLKSYLTQSWVKIVELHDIVIPLQGGPDPPR